MTYYDSIAKGYDELHREEQLKKIRIIKENLRIGPSDKLLDVGCGPYYANFNCDVTGIDESKELLKKAEKKGNIRTVLASAENIPFPGNSFDIVVAITSVQNFRDTEKGLLEMKRVAKNRIVISFLKKSQKKEMIKNLVEKNFAVEKVIEEDKDLIYFLKKTDK